MYYGHIQFYFLGKPCRAFEIIRETDPKEPFSHGFTQSMEPEAALIADADVIVANLQEKPADGIIQTLTAGMPEHSELIVLAEKDQISLFKDDLSKITDIWIQPLSDAEIRFRFLKWQTTYKMQKDFWEEHQFLEATINNVPNLIWYKDKDGIHEKVNDSFCRTVGKTKQQVEGRGHAYIWDVEHDDPACVESEREVMQKKCTLVSEETILTGDGERILTTYKSPLYNLDESVMGTVGVAIDITQEYAYKEELLQKNQTLETLFSTMDCGFMCHSLDGTHIMNINRAALQILGYESLEELIDKGFHMIAPSVVEEDQAKLIACIKGLKEEGDSTDIEYRVQHSDGKILYIMGNIRLVKEHGELCYQRFFLDCTAQKLQQNMEHMEEERHNVELIQALAVDYTMVCFFDLDTGMGLPLRIADRHNHALRTIFNGEVSLKESMEKYIQAFVHVEDRELLLPAASPDILKKELEESDVFHINYRTHTAQEKKYFQLKAVRIGTWEDRHAAVIGLHSVDEETRRELEQKSLLETALQQAKKANKAKSVFLSNMSHDIRTPMNAIVGFTKLAIDHIEEPEQVKSYLEKIMTSENHLLSLINDILDMSRIESGKIHLEEKLCSLPDILHGLQGILLADVYAKNLTLRMNTVDILDEEIFCDKLHVDQVLLNLLSNAIKYTPDGGEIHLKVTEKPAKEGYATYEFLIADTGIGMSEEFVSHIFDPFERERNSTISKIQGTGLGMTITKSIIDMMHGQIAVDSEQNVGTRITVSFTFRLHTPAREPGTIPAFAGCPALIVHEDSDSCADISRMLTQLGMRPTSVLSGKEALAQARQAATDGDAYGVYIIHRLLPDTDGITLTKQIRAACTDCPPTVILTAYDWTDIETEAKASGVTAFCKHPLFLSELRACLDATQHTDTDTVQGNGTPAPSLPAGRILLVEDVELNQEIAATILSEAGFDVDVADNGKVAVDMLQQSDAGYYQVVLMDIQMPVMDGYEATRVIRNLENKELADIPILAMSANAFEEDKQQALACGMNGHIAKPIDVKNLFDSLRSILS